MSNTVPHRPVPCILGPTASGKSQLGLLLRQHWPVEIICVDSATIYQSMDIGTAKPSLEEQRRCPHHLLDILDPTQSYSVGRFIQDVQRLVSDIQGRGHIPLLVGGTMMYFHALRRGIHDLPTANPSIRAQILEEADKKGWNHLYVQLKERDPHAASRFSSNDQQRIQRAWEIILSTGKTITELYATEPTEVSPPLALRTLSLEIADRSILHRKIATRFGKMIALGLREEVERLYRRGDLHIDLPSIRCVGYRQAWPYCETQQPFDHLFIEQATAATRQLAKRQITWQRALTEKTSVTAFSADTEQATLRWFAQEIAQHYSECTKRN